MLEEEKKNIYQSASQPTSHSKVLESSTMFFRAFPFVVHSMVKGNKAIVNGIRYRVIQSVKAAKRIRQRERQKEKESKSESWRIPNG